MSGSSQRSARRRRRRRRARSRCRSAGRLRLSGRRSAVSVIVRVHRCAGVEPGLEEDGGGDLVDHLPTAPPRHPLLAQHPLGGHGGEPLIVGLDRHREHGAERARPRPARPRPPGPTEPSRERGRPTTTTRPRPRRPGRRCGGGPGPRRRSARPWSTGWPAVPRAVGQGDADAAGAEVDADGPQARPAARAGLVEGLVDLRPRPGRRRRPGRVPCRRRRRPSWPRRR